MARGRISAEKVYFNYSRVRESFASLPKRYVNFGSASDRLRLSKYVIKAHDKKSSSHARELHRKLVAIHDICWLEWINPSVDQADRRVKRIGVWGQVWALAVLWSLVARENGRAPVTMPELAKRILEHGKIHNLLPPANWKHELSEVSNFELKTLSMPDLGAALITSNDELLQVLLWRGSKSTIPPVEPSRAIRDCVADFVFHHLSESSEFAPRAGQSSKELVQFLDEKDSKDPEECFWAMADWLGIRNAVEQRERDEKSIPKQTGMSWLEPSVWRYVTSRESEKASAAPDDVRLTVRELRNTLDYQGRPVSDERQIAILTGPAHSGKKSVIGDFFKALIGKDVNDINFPCSNAGSDTINLPVLCIQTRTRDYTSLCIEVLVFLERISDQAVGKTPQEEALRARWAALDQVGGAPSLQSLLDRIGELHATAKALFVFMDVKATSYTDIGDLIKRHGIRRLLETLFSSNSESRFLLSTDSSDNHFPAFNPKLVPLERPTCARIAWYLNDSQQEAFNEAAGGAAFEGLKDKQIDGDVLMALAVLFSQEIDHAELFSLMEKLCERDVDSLTTPIEDVCLRLIESWEAEHLVPFLALIAASEDGMMESTIRACMEEWREANRDLRAADTRVALHRLSELSKLGRGLFLRYQVPPNFVEEEAKFDEPEFDDAKDFFKTWEFDAGFGKVMLRMLAEDPRYKKVLREAYRLVANQARLRSRYRQLKGMTLQRAFGPQIPERSVQSFVALLLSLDCAPPPSTEGDATIQPDAVLLADAAQSVFTLSTGSFDQSAAIRYAYHVLLRSEADFDHRLSMTLDTDLLRSQLYILLCANPGSVGFWDEDRLKLKRDALPEELAQATLEHLASFPSRTRSDILTSLAMAAFYSGQYSTLVWAQEKILAYLLYDQPDRSAVDNASHATAARVDVECQIGRPLRRENFVAVDGRAEALSYSRPAEQQDLIGVRMALLSDMKTIFGHEAAAKEDAETALPLHIQPSEVPAWNRLKVRLDYLDAMIGTRGQDTLRAAAETTAIVQSGRTGRLQMRTRLRYFPLISDRFGSAWAKPVDDSGALLAMERMVDANILRLYRFSGSERALTMMDFARVLMLRGDVPAALRAVQHARRICFFGASSDTVRLDVLFMETAITIAYIEVEHAEKRKTTAELQIAANQSIEQNIKFIDDILDAHGLALEKLTRHVLAWRAQNMARRVGVKLPKLSKSSSLSNAIDLATKYKAAGLCADIEKMRDALASPT